MQNFYGQKYMNSYYVQRNYLEKKEAYQIFETYSQQNSQFNVTNLNSFFNESIEKVARVKFVNLNENIFNSYLNSSYESTLNSSEEFKVEFSPGKIFILIDFKV